MNHIKQKQYTPAGTRPLSFVKTDNRILASAARLRGEPVFVLWVSDLQPGFLRGRLMIQTYSPPLAGSLEAAPGGK